MDLAARRSARQRNDLVMRFGAALLTLGLLVSLVIQPPRAKAVAVVDDIAMIAATFFASCGMNWLVEGADGEEFSNAVAGLLDDYLSTEFAGQTPAEWAGDFTAVASGNRLNLSRSIAQKLGAFAQWTVGKLGITAGSSVPVTMGQYSLKLADGTSFPVQYGLNYKVDRSGPGGIERGQDLYLSSGAKFTWSGNTFRFYRAGDTSAYLSYTMQADTDEAVFFLFLYLMAEEGREGTFGIMKFLRRSADGSIGSQGFPAGFIGIDLDYLGSSVASSGVSIGATAIDIPDTSTMTDEDTLAIDTGLIVPADTTITGLLEQILAAILAGELSASAEIAQEGTKPGEITDVDGLGLPALGVALTTRFPFSIPWDVVRGIQLVAAPAEVPYWEVDFLAPISGRVGGWEGSTKVVIDLGEYPLIGQVCRWTSTIGFCLLLASGTKKLIWTA